MKENKTKIAKAKDAMEQAKAVCDEKIEEAREALKNLRAAEKAEKEAYKAVYKASDSFMDAFEKLKEVAK